MRSIGIGRSDGCDDTRGLHFFLIDRGPGSAIGPYNHIAKVRPSIAIGGTAGVDPATGQLAGPDVYAQTKRIGQQALEIRSGAGRAVAGTVRWTVR